jgi:hypothetical protein
MPKKLNRGADRKIAGENLSGRPVPRKAGLANETGGKSAGTRPGLRSARTVVNFARRGR